MHSFRSISRFTFALALYACFVPSLRAQTSAALDEKVVVQMRELDRRLLEAHEKLDTELAVSLFTRKADAFFIQPGGQLMKGTEGIRKTWTDFFAALEWIHGEIRDVSYFREGDGVIAVGTVVYKRKIKNREPEEKVVVWTDYRRKEKGKWVYVFRHAHWPLENRNPAPAQK